MTFTTDTMVLCRVKWNLYQNMESLVFRRKILCDVKPKPVSRKFLIYAPIVALRISYAYGFVDLQIGRPFLRLLPLTSSCLNLGTVVIMVKFAKPRYFDSVNRRQLNIQTVKVKQSIEPEISERKYIVIL